MVWKICISLILIFIEVSSQENISCSTKCSVEKGESYDCWEETETYAVQQIVYALNNLTGIEIMIERWRVKNNQPDIDINAAVNSTLQRVIDLHMNANGPLDLENVLPVVQLAVQQALNWTLSHTIPENDYLYDYECPIGCDYYPMMWMYLFICVSVILALTLIYIAIYIYRVRLAMQKRRHL